MAETKVRSRKAAVTRTTADSAAKPKARRATTTKSTSKATKKTASVSGMQREQMIRDAAYFRAQSRGFVGGNPMQDWLDAEAEIDSQIAGAGH
ncbi:MAG: DUF2934 domain-containing protein [Gammaproteobacteria bacterium]|nr:DUF2934 domain-containing protein [Gammaproteobacteria bacterium]